MAGKDTKQDVVQKLVDNEIERLKQELDKSITYLHSEERALSLMEERVETNKIHIADYKRNISDIKTRILLIES